MTDQLDPRLARRMRRAIRRLPRDQREVFCAIRFDDLDYYEVAERFDISVAEVEARFAKAIYNYVRMVDPKPRPWWRFW
jgi:RNA polymerase sigma-70 factor (ECF subfamily)